MTNSAIDYNTPASTPRRISKAALCSLIFGILGCIPFVAGGVALLLGFAGFIIAGRPNMKGRWMAVLGILFGLISISAWTVVAGSGVAIFSFGKSVAAAIHAPADATHDFIHDLAAGDEAAAATHSAMSDADLKTAEAIIKAKGDFMDTTFNVINMNEGGSGHVEGTASMSKGLLHVKAELDETGGKWRVTSIELLP